MVIYWINPNFVGYYVKLVTRIMNSFKFNNFLKNFFLCDLINLAGLKFT